MIPSFENIDFTQYSVDDRLALIGRIWDSIDPDQSALPAPPWHEEILRQRLAAEEASPSSLTPWADLKRELLGE